MFEQLPTENVSYQSRATHGIRYVIYNMTYIGVYPWDDRYRYRESFEDFLRDDILYYT